MPSRSAPPLARARTVAAKALFSRCRALPFSCCLALVSAPAQRCYALLPGMLQTLSAASSEDAAVLAAVLGGGCGVNAQVWWRAMARARSGLGVQC